MHVASDAQPLVILGGFLVRSEAYAPMATELRRLTGARVEVVPATRGEWLGTSFASGWRRLLDRVDGLARRLAERSPTGRVSLVGHSSGGVMLRPYLAETPFVGRAWKGVARCDRLVTLGSPHQAVRASPLRARVDRELPGCPLAERVDYVAVAGRFDVTSPRATRFGRRSAARNYRTLGGDARAEGDGLVPLSSALLRGARTLVLDDTAHGGFIGEPWYGTPERVAAWWRRVCAHEGASASTAST
ncbi:MAG: esterase [Myxococcota bacterium]